MLFYDGFFQMFNFFHSCLIKIFVKLGGVLGCVMAINMTMVIKIIDVEIALLSNV